jgi:hypothetical protein
MCVNCCVKSWKSFLYCKLCLHFTNSFYLQISVFVFFDALLYTSFLCFFVFTWFTLLSICCTKLSAVECAFYIFTLSCNEWDLLLVLSLIEHFLCGIMILMALDEQLGQPCFTKTTYASTPPELENIWRM